MKPAERAKQAGAALIVSLVILAILSMLGISTMRRSINELTYAGDAADSYRSFQLAEAGTDAAIEWLQSESGQLLFSGSEKTLDFAAKDPNPLDGFGADTPEVTVALVGRRDTNCPRRRNGSSEDIVGCTSFEIDSVHAPATATAAKGAARTSLTEGISQQVIRRR
ncbi:MAG: pilus assembly PilX N-terminal domain-containing protein [Thiohalocapsa sp.]|nr:pilus assembly PilX N-terminal domain-containing protein [Thiohalocapsa sp.]MCF7990564.1 pilus assembly PilX N-terminal domain-containing protein [Thiohalocapsa sp.]